MKKPLYLLLLPVAFLAGCATTPPDNPSVMVLPGSGKTFDQFRFDDYECRQFASSQIGGATPDQAATDSGVKSAVVGAAIGTVGQTLAVPVWYSYQPGGLLTVLTGRRSRKAAARDQPQAPGQGS